MSVDLSLERVTAGDDQGELMALREAGKTADPTHHPVVGSDSTRWLESVEEKTLPRCVESRLVLSTRAPAPGSITEQHCPQAGTPSLSPLTLTPPASLHGYRGGEGSVVRTVGLVLDP